MLGCIINLLTDYSVQLVLLSSALLGLVCSILGVFVLLRKQAMLGDAVSHAALPGTILCFLLTHSRNPFVLLCGGMASGFCGVAAMHLLERYTKLKRDAIIGSIVSVFFGCGLVLMTLAQRQGVAQSAFLNKFLFGNVATILPADLCAIAMVTVVVCIILVACWKECIVVTFDPVYAHTQGYNLAMLDALITALLMVVIVIGLQTVGVVLISSLLIAPAVAVRSWCSRATSMACAAALIGMGATIVGSLLSCVADRMPAGPLMVIILCLCVACSLCAQVMWHNWGARA